jgi:uncharacterized protein YggL (DUF469 family)
MNKRMRKKNHRGEFTAWGCEFTITLKTSDKFEEFMDAFITEAIEENNCTCGGGGSGDSMCFFVELGTLKDRPRAYCGNDTPTARYDDIVDWLTECDDVKEWKAGEIVNSWKT